MCEKYQPLSTAMYSFINLTELKQCIGDKHANSSTMEHRIQNLVLSNETLMV